MIQLSNIILSYDSEQEHKITSFTFTYPDTGWAKNCKVVETNAMYIFELTDEKIYIGKVIFSQLGLQYLEETVALLPQPHFTPLQVYHSIRQHQMLWDLYDINRGNQ